MRGSVVDLVRHSDGGGREVLWRRRIARIAAIVYRLALGVHTSAAGGHVIHVVRLVELLYVTRCAGDKDDLGAVGGKRRVVGLHRVDGALPRRNRLHLREELAAVLGRDGRGGAGICRARVAHSDAEGGLDDLVSILSGHRLEELGRHVQIRPQNGLLHRPVGLVVIPVTPGLEGQRPGAKVVRQRHVHNEGAARTGHKVDLAGPGRHFCPVERSPPIGGRCPRGAPVGDV